MRDKGRISKGQWLVAVISVAVFVVGAALNVRAADITGITHVQKNHEERIDRLEATMTSIASNQLNLIKQQDRLIDKMDKILDERLK